MAENSSIASPFRFLSYKVDKVRLISRPDLNLLSFTDKLPSDAWKVGFIFRTPLYFKSEKVYVSGLDVLLNLCRNGSEVESALPISNDDDLAEGDILLKVEAGIAGMFAVDSSRYESKVEKQVVMVHFPSLLFPYVRGTITSLLANAGFGTVILPLVNLHALAEDAFKDQEIHVIE